MFRPFVLLIIAAGLFLQSGCGGSDLVNATEVSDNQTPDISDSVQSGQQHLAPVITMNNELKLPSDGIGHTRTAGQTRYRLRGYHAPASSRDE